MIKQSFVKRISHKIPVHAATLLLRPLFWPIGGCMTGVTVQWTDLWVGAIRMRVWSGRWQRFLHLFWYYVKVISPVFWPVVVITSNVEELKDIIKTCSKLIRKQNKQVLFLLTWIRLGQVSSMEMIVPSTSLLTVWGRSLSLLYCINLWVCLCSKKLT